MTEQPKKISLPSKKLSVAQLAICLNVLSKQHGITLPMLIRKLDRVSGNIKNLELVLKGDNKCQWMPQEDALLEKNQGLLVRWKGKECVEERKVYLEDGKGKGKVEESKQ